MTKKSLLKITAFLVIIALNWSGLSAVIQTISYYLDNEGDGANTFTAATLDFSLAAGTWSGNISEFKEGDSVSKTITINNLGSLGFQYIVEAVETSGDHDFCDALDVVAERNGVEMYSGALLGLTIDPPVVYESSSDDVWDFEVSLPAGSFPLETCGFSFKFTGWQTDLPSASSGFSDIEENSNTFTGALGQACDPDDVTLPTDFDQAYWIDKANDGGVVEGSFVFPDDLGLTMPPTVLTLGPTEIKGDLTFGTNEIVIIKGPIYVHGDLMIGAGTTITQHSSFGNNFAVIIVDGVITIADNVTFDGAGNDGPTEGAILLVSRAAAGSTAIDILDGTALNGNLGDAVLFATLGNIHIGDNRTVLDAYIVTEGSSGDTGFVAVNQTVYSYSVDSPDNAFASDDSRAIFNSGMGPDTAEYGFSDIGIPAGATIDGIEVTIEGQSTGARNLDVALWNISNNDPDAYSSSVQVADFTNGSGTDQTLTLNSPVLWGETWTVADFADATFKARVRATIDYAVSIAYLDQLQIKVYYSIAGQTIDNEGTILDGEIPDEAACGPQFMDLNQVVINEFVPNTEDAGISVDTGFKSPTANQSNGSGDDWSNPENAYADGGGYTYEENQERHRFSNFGFGIPSGSTINGIEVKVDAWGSASSGCQLGVDLSWNGGSNWSNEKTQNLTGSESTYYLGNSTDKWGSHNWVQSDFSDSNFRARIHDISGGSCDPRVDWIQVKVYYAITPGSYNTGVMSPTANVQNGAGDDWSNPTNAYANGGGAATDNEGERHQYYNFGFSIPTSATIDGIEVSADAWSTVSTTNTGFKNPSANAADTGGDANGFETNPTNAYTDGSGNASNSNGAGDRHRFYDYGFSIPSGATINGIEVRLDWWLSGTYGNNSMSVELSWNGGLNWTSADYTSSEPTSENTTTLGGSFDTWGRTWSDTEFNNSNFRVRITSNCTDSSYCSERDFYLDWIPVKVYYTPAISSCQLGVDLSWDGGGSWTSEKFTSDLTGSELPYTFGTGATEKWGRSWTPAEINSNFRARVHSCTGGPTTNLDWLRANVYYTVSGGENEWVELYNGTGATVDVNGWALYDSENTHELIISDANTDTGDTIIPAGGYIVVYRDGDADFDLDNTSDTIRLYDDQSLTVEHLVDSHSYNYVGGAPENKSFARVPDGTANWVDPEPTPGRPNNMFVVPYVEEEITEEEPIEEEEIIEENVEEEITEEETVEEETPNEEETPTEEEITTEENQEEGLIDQIVDEIVEEILPETEPVDEEQITEEVIPTEEITNTEETVVEETPTIEPAASSSEIQAGEEQPANETEIIAAPENISTDNSDSSVSENSGGESSVSDAGTSSADAGSSSSDSGASTDSGSATVSGDVGI